MNIPSKINPLGRGKKSDLPSGYLPALFLQTGGGAKIDTGIIPSHVTGARGVVMESTRWCESYTASTNRFVAPAGPNSSNLSLYYFFGDAKWFSLGIGNDSSVEIGEYISELNWLNSRKARLNFPAIAYDNTAALETPTLTATASIIVGSYATKIKSAQFSEGTAMTHDFAPAIDNAGKPCFYEKISKTPFYNASYNDFVIGLTAEQARKLGKLPADATTKTLTVSLPASIVDGETVTDALVQAALDAAASKGWDITIQTYTES